jgi:serine/threonine protein kinase
MLEEILSVFNISSQAEVEPFGTGLINRTWLVRDHGESFILQRINERVFARPGDISSNIDLIGCYLKKNRPDYFFVGPIKTNNGKRMTGNYAEGFYRLFPFVKNSKSYDVVQSIDQAFEAAGQFGLFTQVLSGLDLESLKITLPGFHDLVNRYELFENVCSIANASRLKQAQDEINFLRRNADIVSIFRRISSSSCFKTRVTHHDTKISNVLFNQNDKAICVIDLDTVMPGYFISDVGDMLRTYLSPVSEEEQDLSKIEVREEYFKAILDGYLSKMANELNEEEIRHFVYSGKFMIYMQATRFLSDYLNNDSYYAAAYEGHNYNRARNQITLLKRLQEKESILSELVTKYTPV